MQTSIYGKPLTLVYGTNRIAGDVIGVYDWQAIPVQSGGKGGGKGSGGGKFGAGSGNQQYTYRAAVQIALCQGPITGILSVWLDKTKYVVQTSVEQYTISGSRTYNVKQAANFLSDLGVQRLDAYSISASDYGSPGSTTLSGTQKTPMAITAGTPGAGQYYRSGTSYLFSSADNGKTVYITYSWALPTSALSGNPVADLNLAVFNGTKGQGAWTYLISHHPDQALGYTLLAYLANDNMDLGQSGMIPNYNYEVMGYQLYGNGFLDANPADILTDYLLDLDHGVPGWLAGDLGDLTQFSKYCIASGLFVSPIFDTQTAANSHLEDLFTVTNSAAVFGDGVLKVVPYGDKTVVGNGTTFTPNTQPIYDLDYDDFLAGENESPILIDRPSIWDANNSVKVEWSNRGNDYNREPCAEQSLYHVRLYGLREEPQKSYPMITMLPVAQFVANTQLQRILFIRNHYKFKLPIIYDLLEPMDLVTLTDPNQSLNKTPVRITSVTENDNAELEIEAEEFPWGTATATLHGKQVSSSFTPGYYADPGYVNVPIFFEPTPKLVQDQEYHLYIALSGGQNWGGCQIWESVDDTKFDLVGTQKGPATMGALTAVLGYSGTEIDTTHTLAVSLLESFGELESYTTTQAEQGKYLLQIDNELISYEVATLTGAFTYNVTILHRGMFGTTIASHNVGASVVFLDNSIFDLLFNSGDIGNTRFFKFPSFNQFGQSMQDLGDCAVYEYSPIGISGAITVTNSDTILLSTSQVVNVIATSQDVNIWLPEEDVSQGDDIYIFADPGNSHNVFVRPLDTGHGGDANDTIDGGTTAITLAAGEFWQGVAS